MMREFRPRVRPSRAGLVLAIVVGSLMLVGAVVLGLIATGSNQVRYHVGAGIVDVTSGSRLDGDKSFAVDRMDEVRVIDLRGGHRVRGTAAPGLCTGVFAYPGIGEVWQATDCGARGVILTGTGEDRPIVVSPPDPEAFIAAVKSAGTLDVALAPGNALLLRGLPSLIVLFLVATTSMVVSIFLAGPRRMRYVVDGDRFEVHTIFSKKSWPASELRARRHTPKVTFRLFGTAFPGYYTGLFRADGENTRLYATDLTAGILVEGPARVYVSPADPEGFLAALKEAATGRRGDGE